MTYRYIFKEGKSMNEPVFVLLHGTG
ncbi:MAG: hypothetical protein K0Q56_1911, partial [Sporolactobacillus laevolacticus]|nr:hypothetical protein [Sporolactobacillus laevolacticus]